MLCLLLLHKHSIEILPATKYYHLRNTAADLPTAICLFFREGPHLHVTAVLVTFSGLLTKTKRLVYRIKRTLISLNNREGLENQIFLKAFVSDGTSYAVGESALSGPVRSLCPLDHSGDNQSSEKYGVGVLSPWSVFISASFSVSSSLRFRCPTSVT